MVVAGAGAVLAVTEGHRDAAAGTLRLARHWRAGRHGTPRSQRVSVTAADFMMANAQIYEYTSSHLTLSFCAMGCYCGSDAACASTRFQVDM
jgi:hypothetical protein